MTASTTHRKRHIRGALAVAIATLMMLPGVVAAHHAEITATINCAGLVSFTATAWAGPTAASRTNDDIGVWVSKDGGAFLLLEDDSYFFASSNGFTFSDTYAAGSATTVTVKVQALDNWGNGSAPGDPRQTTVTKSQNCVEPTPTPTATPTDPRRPDPDAYPDRHPGRPDRDSYGHHPDGYARGADRRGRGPDRDPADHPAADRHDRRFDRRWSRLGSSNHPRRTPGDRRDHRAAQPEVQPRTPPDPPGVIPNRSVRSGSPRPGGGVPNGTPPSSCPGRSRPDVGRYPRRSAGQTRQPRASDQPERDHEHPGRPSQSRRPVGSRRVVGSEVLRERLRLRGRRHRDGRTGRVHARGRRRQPPRPRPVLGRAGRPESAARLSWSLPPRLGGPDDRRPGHARRVSCRRPVR